MWQYSSNTARAVQHESMESLTGGRQGAHLVVPVMHAQRGLVCEELKRHRPQRPHIHRLLHHTFSDSTCSCSPAGPMSVKETSEISIVREKQGQENSLHYNRSQKRLPRQ